MRTTTAAMLRTIANSKQRRHTSAVSVLTAVVGQWRRGLATIGVDGEKVTEKPPECTADELHYVSVPGSDWRLALWRFTPPAQTTPRNHPLLLLSGIGTNAIAYDLSPKCSFARYMCNEGFDTWIIEVRGSGLSVNEANTKNIDKSSSKVFDLSKAASGSNNTFNNVVKGEPTRTPTISNGPGLVTKLTEAFTRLSERISGFLSKNQSKIMSTKKSSRIGELQKQLNLMVKYDWDFDNYLEEDIPAAMECIRTQSKPKDGKFLAVGHSMGGILLYAMLSRFASQGRDPALVAAVTLVSSLDYSSSKSVLKLLLPLVDPARMFNIAAIPLGGLVAAVHPLSSRSAYIMSWLNHFISAKDMMEPESFNKLIQKGFCNVSAKLLLQLSTAFYEGGLRDRSGKFMYKDHLHKIRTPILALAGDEDQICPPEAVHETLKLVADNLGTYKAFGEHEGPHYAHYDLMGSLVAVEKVYPTILRFLCRHDSMKCV